MKKIVFILLALTVTLSTAQKRKKRKKKEENPYALADKYFKNYNYKKASELYKDFVKSGDSSLHLLTRIGDCFYNVSNVKEATIWYGKASDKYEKDIDSEHLYKYLLTQRSLGNYDKADEILVKFKALQQDDKRINAFENDTIPNKYELLMDTERTYVTSKEAPFNTKYADFGTFKKDSLIIFSSARVKDSVVDDKYLYEWNQEPFLNVYKTIVTEENDTLTYSDVTPLFPKKKDKLSTIHEASAALSKDGKTLYFTRDHIKAGRKKYSKNGTAYLRLYRAKRKEDGSWGDIEDLSINKEGSSTGHPAVSPDGKYLFFVSDREGGLGQTDIYKTRINNNGTFGQPKNLGPSINSEGREMFPFIAKDSTFYFSSDAHINLGLLDIFKSNILRGKPDDEDQRPINMGAPFNGGFDDFAFYIDSKTNKGYFSSNRPGGTGSDDIYEFTKFECEQTIVGYAKDEKSKEPLDKVTVKLIDATGKILDTYKTKEDGYYKFENVPCDKTLKITGERIIYRPDSKELKTSAESNFENEMPDLLLIPLIQDNEIVINPIFFDLAKHDIRPDAAYELENIVVVMKEHPNMRIKIEAHTDSRGRDAYNEKLSDRRAKSTRDYLYSRGIERERIESAIGYGEKFLLNKCGNGVKCSEEEHQKNRRSKFIITKFK